VLLGVFAGGRGQRMGGVDKASLQLPGGQTLLAHWLRLGRACGLEVVVVGGPARPGVERLQDAPAGVGPLGGLGPLLHRAADGLAVAVACDMPYVEPALLTRLASDPSQAAVVAPRQGGKWQPLFARYDPPKVLPALERALAADERAFQQLLSRLVVEPLPLSATQARQLRDWDSPGDIGDL